MMSFVSSTRTRQNEPAAVGKGRWGRREQPDRKYTVETKQRATALKVAGKNVREISVALSVPYGTVWKWLND